MQPSSIRQFGCIIAFGLLVACQPPEGDAPAIVRGAERIVSLAPHITELVYAAGAGDRLVGTVEYSDYPPDARNVQRVGDSFRVDYERLDVLAPDLVLVWQSGNPGEIVERLRSLDYPVIELEPASLDDIANQILTIGQLAGTETEAEQSADRFRESLLSLRRQNQGVPRISVFYQIAAEPYFTVSQRHVINEAIELCGGRNVFAQVPGLAPSISLEAIIAADPQVIIASVSPGDDQWKSGWQRWESMQAVRNGSLYGVNRDLISRAGPRIVQGIQQICRALQQARDRG